MVLLVDKDMNGINECMWSGDVNSIYMNEVLIMALRYLDNVKRFRILYNKVFWIFIE